MTEPSEPIQPVHQSLEKHVRVEATRYEESAAAEVKSDGSSHKSGEPELPEIHRADVACVGPIMVNSLYKLFGGGLTPLWLGSHPLLLVSLRATVSAMIAVGAHVRAGDIPVLVALLAPLPYLFFDDPFIYWAGRRYGNRLSSYMIDQDPRWEKRIARSERIMERWGFWAIIAGNLPFVPLPVGVLYFIAGDSRMRISLFVLADFIGLFILVASFEGLGYALGQPALDVAATISHYGVFLAIATFAAVVVYVVISTRRNMRLMREREAARSAADAPTTHGDDA